MTTPAATDVSAPRLLLSVAQVAAELGCGRDTVYGLLASGALPSVTVAGRLRRIRRDDLLAYIDRLTVTRPSRGGDSR